jgi:hypothetical protein
MFPINQISQYIMEVSGGEFTMVLGYPGRTDEYLAAGLNTARNPSCEDRNGQLRLDAMKMK